MARLQLLEYCDFFVTNITTNIANASLAYPPVIKRNNCTYTERDLVRAHSLRLLSQNSMKSPRFILFCPSSELHAPVQLSLTGTHGSG